jgi:hypothetical protein
MNVYPITRVGADGKTLHADGDFQFVADWQVLEAEGLAWAYADFGELIAYLLLVAECDRGRARTRSPSGSLSSRHWASRLSSPARR